MLNRILAAVIVATILVLAPLAVNAQQVEPTPYPAQQNGQLAGEIAHDAAVEVGQGVVAWGETIYDTAWDYTIQAHNGLVAVDNAITGFAEGYTGMQAPAWYTAEPIYPAPPGCYYDEYGYWICP